MTPEEIRANHFARLNDYRQTKEYDFWMQVVGHGSRGDYLSLIGQRWEINEEIYDEFLNMLPPLHWRGGSFYCMEECFDGFHAKFSKEGGRCFCEYARLPGPAAPVPAP